MGVKEEISRNLQYFRKRAGFTQKELADRLGVKHNAVSQWETGKNAIDIEVLYDICLILGISITELYGSFSGGNQDDLSVQEQLHIKKYRILDEYGRRNVDVILDNEHDRVLHTEATPSTMAAHVDENAPAPDASQIRDARDKAALLRRQQSLESK